jgi:hypothetical protein
MTRSARDATGLGFLIALIAAGAAAAPADEARTVTLITGGEKGRSHIETCP